MSAHAVRFPSPIAKQQAVDELRVFLRTMAGTQRRWTREISARELTVRKRMMEEDQCRERLRRVVLRGATDHLKNLRATTDLLSSSQESRSHHVTAEHFKVYGIPKEQVTPFSVYSMARLRTNPAATEGDLMLFPIPLLIAEYQTGWATLSPQTKQQYVVAAQQLQAAMDPPQVIPAATAIRAATRLLQSSSLTSSIPASPSSTPAISHRVGRKGKTRRNPSIRSRAPPEAKQQQQRQAVGSAVYPAPWEKAAFQSFLHSSFAPIKAHLGRQAGPRKLKGTSVRLTMKKWIPVAVGEWQTLTESQKRKYINKKA